MNGLAQYWDVEGELARPLRGVEIAV